MITHDKQSCLCGLSHMCALLYSKGNYGTVLYCQREVIASIQCALKYCLAFLTMSFLPAKFLVRMEYQFEGEG